MLSYMNSSGSRVYKDKKQETRNKIVVDPWKQFHFHLRIIGMVFRALPTLLLLQLLLTTLSKWAGARSSLDLHLLRSPFFSFSFVSLKWYFPTYCDTIILIFQILPLIFVLMKKDCFLEDIGAQKHPILSWEWEGWSNFVGKVGSLPAFYWEYRHFFL